MMPVPDPQLVVHPLIDVRHPIKMQVAEWAREALDPGDMIDRDLNCTFFREAWTACAAAGLPASVVPIRLGRPVCWIYWCREPRCCCCFRGCWPAAGERRQFRAP